ncbi:MAG: hypothetical protein GWN18_17950 [Thermoplasmata archaeon]|nr:YdhR family protein [Thermoplasmata archaeon]NIS14008.1 YdhR family protein [Thermoplasmata archaeon]NIS21840.1 YdhR family protein [Thermoplasmata archaeon]NIT79445.1 YdhR family protein [Thermoplasmata archaeon]NIU50875.1 YdhR family protein [Thermoplasmata archaeon]
MGKQLLQLNFKFGMERNEYEAMADELAGAFANVDGLEWKVWLMDEEHKGAGGIYMFDSESSLNNFLSSDLAEQVTGHPAFSDLDAKPFEVLDSPSRTTRAPL